MKFALREVPFRPGCLKTKVRRLGPMEGHMSLPISTSPNGSRMQTIGHDLTAGLVVFLVALPLCLGIALASNAPLLSGLLAGIVGGLVVGVLSGSHSSVSGPAAGLTAVVAAQIATLGSFESFLLAVMVAGLVQIILGVVRAGFLAAFFPSSVIKGLLAAIGVILILKQIPHVVGHDPDPEGEMSFIQPDQRNTFSELADILDIEPGAALIGLVSIAALVLWARWKVLKKSPVPGELVVVLLGLGLSHVFRQLGQPWIVDTSHLVQVPEANSLRDFFARLPSPDFSQLSNPAVYRAGLTIAIVASLETLLNLEAVDKLDPLKRVSPPSRELAAQGVGNILCGFIGGLPMTSVIVRSSVNMNAGARTKTSAIFHGVLLAVCVVFIPGLLNQIPLSCLAAILLVTGFKLASPKLVMQMWRDGKYQFLPFASTVVAIVLTDLLVGVLLGLVISVGFILWSNARKPMRIFHEHHLGGEVVHIELANQVSFLNRAALSRALDDIPRGGQVLLDAQNTHYIDPDVLGLIRDYKDQVSIARGVEVSLMGFRTKYDLSDQIQYVDYATRELQSAMTPAQVLQILKDGHDRFRTGRQLTRDFGRQINATSDGQHPLAVVLSCIDSRTPNEIVLDMGVGDILSVRIAGNILSRKVLGSLEYSCLVAGAKLILVMGHTRCGAVTQSVNLCCGLEPSSSIASCENLPPIVAEIKQAIDPRRMGDFADMKPNDRIEFINLVARTNVIRTREAIMRQSQSLKAVIENGKVAVVGSMYNVATGELEFLDCLS